jgi:hypothetical protein
MATLWQTDDDHPEIDMHVCVRVCVQLAHITCPSAIRWTLRGENKHALLFSPASVIHS